MTLRERKALVAALEVAIAAPLKPARYAFAAKIPWTRIAALRTALDDLGVEWRDVKRRQDEADVAAGDVIVERAPIDESIASRAAAEHASRAEANR